MATGLSQTCVCVDFGEPESESEKNIDAGGQSVL